MKDEIASYLERNGKLAPEQHGYLSKNNEWWIVKELYWYDFNYVYLFHSVLHELISRGAKNKDIVDIVRTSSGFEHAYARFREKYAHVVDLPIDIKHWKLKGIDEIIAKLNKYNEAIWYDYVELKKNGDVVKTNYYVKIRNTLLNFHLEAQPANSEKLKTFLEDIYNKINSSPTIGIEPTQDELKNFLIPAIKNFWNANIGSSFYIDSDLTLHSQTLGTFALFDNSPESKVMLAILFPNINNAA